VWSRRATYPGSAPAWKARFVAAHYSRFASNFSLIASEHVVGAKIYDASGKEIGEIDHLMIDRIDLAPEERLPRLIG
jgi:hypothetical protein